MIPSCQSAAFLESVILGLGLGLELVCVAGPSGLGTEGNFQPSLRQVSSLPVSCLPSLGKGLKVSLEANIFAWMTEV